MRLLLDTHIMIWAIIDPRRLKGSAAAVLEDPGCEVLFSVASVWEMAIKASLGRADFGVSVDDLVDAARASGFVELPVRADVALAVGALPMHHRDPFDRLLVAQAMALPARLVTADAQLQRYSELVTLV